VRRSSTRRRARHSILVADPNESARSLVEAVLKSDHWVRAVASAAEAAAAYDVPRAFDYVVLDDALVGAFEAIKKTDAGAKIVLLVGAAESDEARRVSQQAYAILRKPEQLKDVRELLG
jgi:DNA-binding NtrC family response regulator